MDAVEDRKMELLKELEREVSKHERRAHYYEIVTQLLFYIALVSGGLAVVSGLIKNAVPTEVISLLAGLGTGATTLAKTANFRAVADWNYEKRDTAKQLVRKLKYQIPIPATQESISEVSEEWSRRSLEFGNDMVVINPNKHSVFSSDKTDKRVA